MAMLKLPQQIDANEWFVLASIALLIICYIIVPKIMPRGMIVSILLLFAVFGFTADVIIGVDFPIDFYTITDSRNLEVLDVLIYTINYPFYGYFFSYIMYKWMKKTVHLIWFIPSWCLLSGAIEWLSIKFNVFTYHQGWTTWHSVLLYMFVFTLASMATKLFIRYWITSADVPSRPI